MPPCLEERRVKSNKYISNQMCKCHILNIQIKKTSFEICYLNWCFHFFFLNIFPLPTNIPSQVDDILGEGSDDSDSEKKKTEEEKQEPHSTTNETLNLKVEERPVSTSSSERSLTGSIPRYVLTFLNESFTLGFWFLNTENNWLPVAH